MSARDEGSSDGLLLHHPARAAGGLMAAVEHVGDLVDLLQACGGVAGGGPQVDVPEPGRDRVHRHARLQAMGGPVGTQRVRVAEPLGHASGHAAAAYEPVHAHGGQGERLLVSVAAQPDKQRGSSSNPTPRATGCALTHASSACCTAKGNGTSRSRPPLPRYEQPVVPGV
jgi:hypothetical protein